MCTDALITPAVQPAARKRALIRSAPVFLALLAIGGIYSIVSAQFSLGPRGLVPGLIVPLVLILVAAIHAGHGPIRRSVGMLVLGVVTLAEAISTGALIASLVFAPMRMSEVPHDTALLLLRDAALIWLVNILTFACWYWELDGGGASHRQQTGYQGADFIFPQGASERRDEQHWTPHFVDYLFLAFNASTAFSPTDTQVISVRAKLLMMLQSLISLTVLAIIAARAINTL